MKAIMRAKSEGLKAQLGGFYRKLDSLKVDDSSVADFTDLVHDTRTTINRHSIKATHFLREILKVIINLHT